MALYAFRLLFCCGSGTVRVPPYVAEVFTLETNPVFPELF